MARLILTNPGEDVEVGGNVEVIGTTTGGEVITVMRGNISLDPSFNTGGDTVRLPDIASAFSVKLSGSVAVLVGQGITISIPIGSAGLLVAFDDVSRTLLFDAATGTAKLGDQTLTSSETGVLPVGATGQILGTEAANVIHGTGGNDVVDGLGGNDTIYGHGGDDFIRGGAGDDTIDGGDGEDTIIGGSGNDRIIDNEGGYGVIDGGIGNDHISIDNLAITSLNITGGDGDDLIELNLGTVGLSFVSAGSGADRVVVQTQGSEVSLLLGAGADQVVMPTGALDTGNFGFTIIRDFEVGATGDKVDLSGALNSYLEDYAAGSNPFASGHLRLIDFYGNAYLQVDRDGATGPNTTFANLINFAGTDRAALTAANFTGFDPAVSIAASGQSVQSLAATLEAAPAVQSQSPSAAPIIAAAVPDPAVLVQNDHYAMGDSTYAPLFSLHHTVDHGSYYFLA